MSDPLTSNDQIGENRSNMNIEFYVKSEIESNISRIDELINSGIFKPENMSSLFFKSAFIEVLICLRDLMYKAEKYSSRVSFDEDVVKTTSIKDVSDVIKYVRDALCHFDSENHYLIQDKVKASYNVIFGKNKWIQIGDIQLISDYEDDICFFLERRKYIIKDIS